jgi:hypothetical protein
MKKTISISLALVFTSPLFADSPSTRVRINPQDIVRIEIGRDAKTNDDFSGRRRVEDKMDFLVSENMDLHRRVRQLEMAVQQLQQQVYDLGSRSRNEPAPVQQGKKYACSLSTSFNGTFLGTGTTKLEATVQAVQKCKASGAPFCHENDAKCEREGD